MAEPIPPMTLGYKVGWASGMVAILIAQSARHGGLDELTSNFGYALGYIGGGIALGLGIGWLAWRGGLHKHFPPKT